MSNHVLKFVLDCPISQVITAVWTWAHRRVIGIGGLYLALGKVPIDETVESRTDSPATWTPERLLPARDTCHGKRTTDTASGFAHVGELNIVFRNRIVTLDTGKGMLVRHNFVGEQRVPTTGFVCCPL